MTFQKGNTASVGNKGGGRKSTYLPEYAKQAKKLCLLGATDAEMAKFFEIGVNTLNVWKRTYPDFKVALKEGKEQADAKVASSLYNRALGYKCKATKVMQYKGKVVKANVTEHYPPDTTAAIFWLKNRRPDKWRDRQAPEADEGETPTAVKVNVVDSSVPDSGGE